MENTQQKQQKGGKLCDRWLGPYIINRNLGKGLYELRNCSVSVLKMKCNIARLKVMYFNCLIAYAGIQDGREKGTRSKSRAERARQTNTEGANYTRGKTTAERARQTSARGNYRRATKKKEKHTETTIKEQKGKV